MVGTTVNNTIVQRIVPDAVRGRVMSLLMMTFGLTPLGTPPIGWLARAYGVRAAVRGGGASSRSASSTGASPRLSWRVSTPNASA